ncbi:alkaline-phosphatase-like protein [Stachybotrys elegans]|uniref:Arylsulfatase n=1 Tax=Stachybotrys elegans TaxID=80388 RepID=A0A8K0SZG2_9HYPO|nr:alkaline-phosphatase-like protein [Stachybotrys elegans]
MRASLISNALATGLAIWLDAVLAEETRPNILFILTDDQDWYMKSLDYMPFVQKLLVNEGTTFPHHYCTVALCCPSRVNLWTGRAAHNTNITDVKAPYGGYPRIVQQGIHEDFLPVWLQAAGYNTYYTGKLWNQHTVENHNNPPVKGFNGSDFLLDPHTYQYYNASMSRNGEAPVSYAGQYSPDVTAKKAYEFLNEAMSHPDPWFVVHAPIAPHGDFRLLPVLQTTAPQYADRHAHLFQSYIIPRDEAFNPEEQGGVGWVKNLPRLNDTVIAYNDEYQRARLRALQAVDEMVEKAVAMLEENGQLENTYIIYTADNGYHISQHRMHPGKECGFETDVHVPLVIRGPGIRAGHVSDAVTSHTDFASTIMKIAGTSIESDGQPIPLTPEQEESHTNEHVTIEHWGSVMAEGILGAYSDEEPVPIPQENDDLFVRGFYEAKSKPGRAPNATLKAIRVISQQYNLYYAVWCTNETELYDHTNDPGQVRNLFDPKHEQLAAGFQLGGRSIQEIAPRLDSLMMVLKSCKGETCIHPWAKLHPDGGVKSLLDSLDRRFDEFYDEQPRVSFSKCEMGYIRESEGPMDVNAFGYGNYYWEELGGLLPLRKQGGGGFSG